MCQIITNTCHGRGVNRQNLILLTNDLFLVVGRFTVEGIFVHLWWK